MTVYGLKSNLSRNKLNGRLTRNGGKGSKKMLRVGSE